MNQPLINKIQRAVIGDKQLVTTCFGSKPLTYADYTASGRSLDFIEDYIREQVLPYYANTHTETSFTGAQTTKLREQARQIIREAVNGTSDDQIIFCGPGATAAINKLIDILNLRLPADLAARYSLLEAIPREQRPVVFIGPYEHHSNELPWRESIAEVVAIPLTQDGLLDINALEQQLKIYRNRPQKIGSFSAASNVTGIKTNIGEVTKLLHKYDALSFWDYAAAAPYVTLDMNPAEHGCSMDAVFISPHKFVGGPGTPGVLVVKKHFLNNSVPTMPGGGTVLYVTPDDHQFLEDHERREEGGTPAIVEAIRAGLVFKLQQEVGTELIEQKEHDFVQRALSRWQSSENIEVLGNTEADRLSIISMRIKRQGKDLHYGFVVALLNDLFGIQARGGCSCAGPYGHCLLGMDMAYSKALEEQLTEGLMIFRPGWIRLNFNYFIDEQTFDYLLRAVELIAEFGWRLLPYYFFDKNSGTWRYQKKTMSLPSDLNTFYFETMSVPRKSPITDIALTKYLEMASAELQSDHCDKEHYPLAFPQATEHLRWFVLPQEVLDDLN